VSVFPVWAIPLPWLSHALVLAVEQLDGIRDRLRSRLLPRYETVRVIVCGSRYWQDREAIANRLFDLPTHSVIVHGAAKGADRIAGQEAEKLGLLVEEHPADWDYHGRRAGFIRNERMAMLGADLCLAFWDGRSSGTAMMVDLAEKHGIPLELYTEGAP